MADESLPDNKVEPAAEEPSASRSVAKAPSAAAKAASDDDLDNNLDDDRPGFFREALVAAPGWLVSMLVHMVAMLMLGLWFTEEIPRTLPHQLVTEIAENQDLDKPGEPEDEPLLEPMEVTLTEVTPEVSPEIKPDEASLANDLEAASVAVELSDFGIDKAPRSDMLTRIGSGSGTGIEGRGGNKAALVAKHGGNDKSEQAVAKALEWLAEHQMPDGGWSFDLTHCPSCHGQCRHSGRYDKARNAATALAILPFLGAGHTHKTGQYQKVVRGGIYYLINRIKSSRDGGSLLEDQGVMYSHGLASIALCEAFAMTHDKALAEPAQSVVDFICSAQDPVGGGWRYYPRTPGDTSVVGWQLMALKSAHMAYLRVPPQTVRKGFDFLDSVQSDSGATYGYQFPGRGPAQTAIGLLSRMYLGWKKDNPALQRGIKFIAATEPSQGDFYFNYYATQVMRHWEGEEWDKWNNVMRDQLIESQSKRGHEAGSWYTEGRHNDSGGRLYCTAMATMILEVYYRHLPIYRSQSVDDDFPL